MHFIFPVEPFLLKLRLIQQKLRDEVISRKALEDITMSMKDADKNNRPINIKNFAALAGIVLLAAPALAQELPDQSSSLPAGGKDEDWSGSS